MAASVRTAVLRVVFLGVLAVGVVSMHTVGHAGPHGGWAAPVPGSGPDHAMSVVYPQQVRGIPDHAPCDQDQCLAGAPVPVPGLPEPVRGPGSAGLVIMCLAVFLGIGFLALLAAALSRHRQQIRPERGWRLRGVPRSSTADWKPTSTLRLVEVAVLRT